MYLNQRVAEFSFFTPSAPPVEDIIKKIDRARIRMEQIRPGSTQPRGKKKADIL